MRPLPLLAVCLVFACKSNPSSSGSASSTTLAATPAQPPSAADPHAGNPHAGLDPATAARAESARAAGIPPQGVSPDSPVAPRIVEPHRLAALPQGRAALGPFSVAVPADWQEKPSTSSMRAAEFTLPAKDGSAEVIVYYFGQNGAGSVQDNIDRWVGQFTQADGKPSKDVAKVEQATFAGQPASMLSVSGHYAASAMPGGQPVDKADQSLLAAIVPSPKGPYYFRLIGDSAAVAAQSAKFRELLGSLKIE